MCRRSVFNRAQDTVYTHRCSSTHTKTMTIYTMMSAAKAVKARTGGAIVNYNEEQQGAPPAAAAKPKATPAKAKAAKAPAPVVTGGKARKTGFVLARAKLGAATSELAATRDRQGALLGKGVYRDAERRLAARRRRARCRRRRSRSEGTPSRTRCTRRHSSRGWRGKKMWSTWKVDLAAAMSTRGRGSSDDGGRSAGRGRGGGGRRGKK